MPSLSRIRRRVYDEDDDDQILQVSSPSSTGTKRRRIHDDDSEDDAEESEDEGDDGETEDIETERFALPEATVNVEEEEDVLEEEYEITGEEVAFQPGAIIRIKLTNFVTYTEVELRPGPSLNMIIGPNGTGKSTIVCAICLGLGYPPINLGRATEVSAYVKHGYQDAFIEIELQGREGERNPVLRRKLSRENNTSSYWLNGKLTTFSKIQKLTRSFNIQVDNLCQFLPQDRVQEFSRVADTLRLIETERAAAGPEVLEWHKRLIDLGKEANQDHEVLRNDKTQLQQLEARQAVLQQDVERLRERQDVIAKIELLEKMKPYLKYQESAAKANKARERCKVAEAELRKIKADMGPAMERPRAKKRYKEAIENVLNQRSRALDGKQDEVKRQKRAIPDLETESKDIHKEITVEIEKESKRKDEIKKMKKQLDDIKKKLDAGPPAFDVRAYNEKLNAKRIEMRGLKAESESIRAETATVKAEGESIQIKLRDARQRLQNLDSLAGQREAFVQKKFPDTYKAWRWYQQNKDMFEKEIFAPPIFNCSARDPQYTNIVEIVIGGASMAFVCQTTNDYYLFMKETLGNKNYQGLGLADVTIKNYSGSRAPHLGDHRRRYSPELVSRLGFDGVALDFIQGPEPVLNMICHDCNAHDVLVTLREFNDEENKRCEESGVSTWFAGKTHNSVRKRYGSSTTIVNTVRPAQLFITPQLDPNVKHQIQRDIAELEDQDKEIKANLQEKKTAWDKVKLQMETVNREQTTVTDEKNKKQTELGKYNTLKVNFSSLEEKIAEKLDGGARHKDEMKRLDNKLDKIAMKRAQAAIKFARLVDELVNIHNDLVKLQIRHVEACSDEKILEHNNQETIRQKDEKERECLALQHERRKLKDQAKREHEILEEVMSTMTDEDRDVVANLAPTMTFESIEDELETEQARLSLIHEGNPNAIKQYQEREARINTLQKKILQLEEKLEIKDTAIQEIRDLWEPEVERLIAKISAAFSKSFQKIGCAGEVRLIKSEEGYDQWAAEILVKFREEENFQVLDQFRQSGGERSVTTIFYLMALQSLAKSPFRVVDEINQGMDPRNERVVHHRMVNIACQEHTSQYFLITPKLLSDLMYHPRMMVHCIYSGEWVGEGLKMDFKRFLKAGRKMSGKSLMNGSVLHEEELSEEE